MSLAELLVVASGLAAIAWINWYFFIAGRRPVVAGAVAERQEVTVTVRGGYEPGAIRVRRGAPVRIIFDRQETSGCSDEVVFPAFGVKRYLPAYEKTAVELTPSAAGTYEFTCGMGMLRGTLIVEEGEG